LPISGAGRTTVRSTAELNDAVAVAVAGARIHSVAFHQHGLRKVIRQKAVLAGQGLDALTHRLAVKLWDVTEPNGTVQGLRQQ
jgi:hypothetical protein